jgi:hypothetical protein
METCSLTNSRETQLLEGVAIINGGENNSDQKCNLYHTSLLHAHLLHPKGSGP